ncbi:MAG: GNAT family N-acetyltransferase [Micavibrio sp.]
MLSDSFSQHAPAHPAGIHTPQAPCAAVKPALKLTVAFLGAADIPAFIALQQSIRAALEKDYHIKPRTAADLKHHFGERMPLIGVKDETGALAGGCLISFLKNHDAVKNITGYPIGDHEKSVTAIAQSVCVAPALRGNGIAGLLLDAAHYVAEQNNMTQIISAIADDNLQSSKAFKAAGYSAFAHGFDPHKAYAKTYYRLLI